MNKMKKAITILMAEDDPDDRLIIKDAFEEAHICNTIHYVEDGEEFLDYLYSRGKYSWPNNMSRPGIILLDLNLPKLSGQACILASIAAIPGAVFAGHMDGRVRAYEELERTSTPFRELLGRDPGVAKHLNTKELDELFDLQNSIRNVDAIFARVGLS